MGELSTHRGNVKNDGPELIDQIPEDEPPPSLFGT